MQPRDRPYVDWVDLASSTSSKGLWLFRTPATPPVKRQAWPASGPGCARRGALFDPAASVRLYWELEEPKGPKGRCQANLAHVGHSSLDSGLDFETKVFTTV